MEHQSDVYSPCSGRPCGEGGSCEVSNYTYTCTCNAGYINDGTTCGTLHKMFISF